ncbi:disks large-associated protein 5 isoform X1 [Formica exsecta]|uniref:disks large-associated protein 5 isoform X1 n=1 Tax=Formica exsecta TaxID=72781 RepID=UPI001141D34C|nr:disks large-associated protein 5 isoform X1 [Formica exsecta]
MSDFKQQYKNPRPGFGHTDHNRILRAYKHVESRREVRTRAFDNNRRLQDVSVPASPFSTEATSITDTRMKKLMKWKEERKKKKKLENTTKKPAFKVGIVHHSLCSPVIRSNASTAVAKTPKQATRLNNVQKRITKATEKRLLAKAASAAKQSTATTKNASTSTKYPMNIKKPTSNTKNKKSFAPANHEFRPPSGLHNMPLFGLVPIEETPQEKGNFFIQNKLTECKTVDISEQKDISSQKLYAEIPDTSGTTVKLKTPASPKLLPNKQKSSQRLNESICNLNDVTYELNRTATRSSLKEQTIQDSFQDKPLSDNMQTPSQKSTPSDTSSAKENCTTNDLIQFSPYLTLSRGKKNARKEQQQRLGIGRLSPDEIPTKDTVMKNLNISVEEEVRTAQYFKFLLNKETERLRELCKTWLDIKLEKDIPDDVMYEINQAVGQTNLLINKKFERFRGLVEDCEIGKGEKLVTCRDLQGFWDMTYMEVRDCDSRFEKLEQRRNRGWLEEECIVAKPAAKKRMPIKKQPISSKPSSLRSLIVAARKKKMEVKTSNLMQDTNTNIKYFTPSKNSKRSANFDNTNIQSSTKKSKSLGITYDRKSTPVRHESSRTSLLQKVQFSDDKRIKSPLIAMKVSKMGKTPEVQLDDTISYINSGQTPGKSILKKSEELVDTEIRAKSAHKVNFDDQIVMNEVPLDEETQTKLNLSIALNKIDSLDLDELSPQECINAERKLDFETEDFDNFDDMNEISAEIHRFKKKSNESKIFEQNTFDSNAHSFNDTTFSISDKESSPRDAKVISPKKKLKHRNQHKNATNILVNILPATPLLQTKTETSIISDTISNTTDMENHDTEIRILRNRTITANNTPKNNRTSEMITLRRISKKENKSPVKPSRKSSLKLSQKNGDNYMIPNKGNITEMEHMILTENIDKRRRSSRKSVAFNEETCLVCAESKPVLPMTPHAKRNRSKTPSRQSRSKHVLNEDLISWDTPKHLPNRVTRSQPKN